ncbi:hypothetical protein J3E72DRAFT_379690 [Bipolaris maydis]|nr:hypothetical protein J3E72DRAFT_379690 [Bipolaris maydis]
MALIMSRTPVLLLPIDDGPILTSEPVKVVVGSSETTSFLNEAHLRASSNFNKMFDRDWKERATRTVALPEVISRPFSTYAKWLYTGCFYTTEPDDRTYSKEKHLNYDKELL